MTEGVHARAASEDDPPHGSVGEEAAKLADAVQQWLAGRTGRPADVWAAATAAETFESPECRVCPLCRAMHAVTSGQPEVLAHLTAAAAAVAAAVRAVAEPRTQPDRTAAAPDGPPAQTPSGDT